MGFLKSLLKGNARIYKAEARTVAKALSDLRETKKLSSREFVLQVDTLLPDLLYRMGIPEKLSNDQYKQIAQVSILFTENQKLTVKEADEVLQDFISP